MHYPEYPVTLEVKHTNLATRMARLQLRTEFLKLRPLSQLFMQLHQRISPEILKSLGFNAIITDAYIACEHHGENAREKGIHHIVNFHGIVNADSSGYQVLVPDL